MFAEEELRLQFREEGFVLFEVAKRAWAFQEAHSELPWVVRGEDLMELQSQQLQLPAFLG